MAEWDVEFEHGKADDGSPVLAVAGEIDLAVVQRLSQELADLIEHAGGVAIVDLSRVGFMDSSGVRELLKARKAAEQRNVKFMLRAPSDSCQHVLQVSGAWSEFEVQQGS
jgi:anti-sigma B factor antagonist